MQAARGASLNPSDTVDHDPDHVPGRRRLDARIAASPASPLVAYALDLASKQWALSALADGDIAVLGDWFTLHLTFNPGAAFSTGTDFTIVFTCLAHGRGGRRAVVEPTDRAAPAGRWRSGFLLGGVSGNLTDRLVRDPEPLHGHVVDFLMLPNWPVFNIADICINVAAGLIILQTFRGIALDGTARVRRPAPAATSDEHPHRAAHRLRPRRPRGRARRRRHGPDVRVLPHPRRRPHRRRATCSSTASGVGKSDRVHAGSMLDVTIPAERDPLEVKAEVVEGIRIIHDDDAIVVIDKPVGVAVHPSPGWRGPTVVGHLAGAGYRISTSGAQGARRASCSASTSAPPV